MPYSKSDCTILSSYFGTPPYLTQFSLPTAPYATAIASGIAFIADDSSGLQVVNYLPFDNKG
ncbi:MAG: hypothetical protein ACJ8CN_14085, partial [Gemmatimonadales bacterium]